MEEQKNDVGQEPESKAKTPIEKKLDELEAQGVIPKAGEEQQTNTAELEKPLTPEQEAKKAELESKRAEHQKKELEKKQNAYKMLQQGAYFMKFIYDDIERQKKEHFNRHQRRRFEKELGKGIFSKELVEVYSGKIDVALNWIEKNITTIDQTKNKVKTHYKTQGFENPEFLKTILEDYFGDKFFLPEGPLESVDGAEFYKELKEKEARGELTE